MTARVRFAVTLAVFGCGCAAAAPVSHGGSRTSSAEPQRPRAPADPMALEAIRARMAAGEADALETAAVHLASGTGAREITGETALDERVSQATLLAREGDAAAVLVTTTCGNATLATLHWRDARWSAATHVPLVADMHPGRCAQTTVHGEALSLSSDARREIAIVMVSQDSTGESVRGPYLSVYQLREGGTLDPLLADAPFGAMDDDTGATTTGAYLVIPDVPPPRDLHVSIRPGRPGPGGAPAREIVRRRYALRGGRLEMVQQTTESAE